MVLQLATPQVATYAKTFQKVVEFVKKEKGVKKKVEVKSDEKNTKKLGHFSRTYSIGYGIHLKFK